MVELSIGSCESRVHGIRIGRRFQHRFHVGRALRRFDLRHAFVVGARHFVEFERKLIMLQTHQPISEVIDGVVRAGQRAVAAGIGHRELKIARRASRWRPPSIITGLPWSLRIPPPSWLKT